MNESELVQGLRQRNPAAVQYLSDCYLPSVWRFVYLRVGGDRHLADDIMSETVLALIRTAAAPDAVIGNVEGWLRSVAGNKVADHFRAAARVQHLIEQATPTLPVADHNDPAVRQEQAEQCAEVRRVMDALPPRHRLVLEWKYLDKLSVREIGRRMQMTEKAAESILFRARREFRDRLQHGVAEESDESEEQSDGVRHNGHCCRQVQQPPAERGQDRNSSGKEARIPVSTPDDTANS